jgi:thiol-disulfide isomerase/thioredoxin
MVNKSLILSATMLITIITACSNFQKEESGTSTINVQQNSVDSNAAEAIVKADQMELPAFSLQDMNGSLLNLQSFKGKKVFVNLWATWCPPCRAEIPSIQKLAQSVDTAKVAFVMISLDDSFDKARRFAKSRKMILPVFYPAENLPELFNVQSIPSTFIFDESGKLIQRVDGGDNYNTKQYKELFK